MADSIREQIVAAFIAALKSGGPAPVYDELGNALDGKAKLPAFVVEVPNEQIARGDHESDRRTLLIRTIAVVSRPEGDVRSVRKVADPLLAWIEQKVADNPTFGGMATDAVVSGIAWAREVADQDYIGADAAVVVTYFTKRGDPTQSAS